VRHGSSTPKNPTGIGGRHLNTEVERRIGRNEGLFRRVNEAIARGLWPGEEQRAVAFRCECARLDCNNAVRVTPSAYEQVRAHPRRFLLTPGHEIPDAETVIETHPTYVVVEKREEAAVVAERMDPRQ
jgi:hypothetical protein